MRIFISYSSDERAEALAVQSWLEKNGWEKDVFVDVDPEHGLTGGEAWRSALRDAAGRCEAIILLVSRAWLASKPCWNEFQLAEKYGKPRIPVRVDDAVSIKDLPREITNNYQVIEKASAPPARGARWHASAVSNLLARASTLSAAKARTITLTDGRNRSRAPRPRRLVSCSPSNRTGWFRRLTATDLHVADWPIGPISEISS
jgi:hypothetical protein